MAEWARDPASRLRDGWGGETVYPAWTLGGYCDWYADAACRDRGVGLWFASSRGLADVAIAICHTCPVERECLELALEYPELEGIWGGADEHQRDRIRARRRSELVAVPDASECHA